jgi:2-polyprenyl-6-methoxyphenol hydroxylase-like FAD-dependent oxidoreductase
MPARATCDVLVVGAGPVGLTLAAALGRRGVDTLVAERRGPEEPTSVKANHVSARSMEIFRRLGVADAVRAVGLPDDYPHDVAFRVTTTGTEFARTRIPSRRGRSCPGAAGPDTTWPTPEPAHRINQIYLEPVLRRHVEGSRSVRLLERTEVTEVAGGASAVARRVGDDGTDETVHIDCRYLVGCDGASSLVRKAIGATLEGTPVISRWQSTYVRAPGLLDLLSHEAAWMTLSVNPRCAGTVIAVDGVERWLVHARLNGNAEREGLLDRDASLRAILGVGEDFEYELLSTEDWVGRRLVANRFQRGRMFICGDAAHLWVPFSGYGMNAGIADAEDLAWMLVATLHGWGGRRLLDAYEAERGPITDQVSRLAMNLSVESQRMDEEVPAAIEDPGDEGERVRAAFGERARELSLRRHTAGGLNFGYFYEDSPVIAYDGVPPPAYDAYRFEQSTVPGCRTPHVWLSNGRSLYDELDEGFCLIRTAADVDVVPLLDAAAERGVPLKVVELGLGVGPELSVYDRALVLSRPDGHVAWRGDRAPQNPGALIDLVRGAAEPPLAEVTNDR